MCIYYSQTVLKAYLQGVWDSIKGISLIFIVIRDTSSFTLNKAKQSQLNNVEERDSQVNTSTSSGRTSRGPSPRNNARREQSKLDE